MCKNLQNVNIENVKEEVCYRTGSAVLRRKHRKTNNKANSEIFLLAQQNKWQQNNFRR